MTDARPRAQTSEGLDDERKAVGQVVTRPAVELHPLAFFAGDHPEAVVLVSCTHSSPQGGCGAHFCFRNSKLEDFHDRISDAEMKALMIDVVNHSHLFLSVLFSSTASNEIIEILKQGDDLPPEWKDWNEPEISDELTKNAKRVLDLIAKSRQ